MRSRAEVVSDSYVDSVRLLEATRAMREASGIDWAWAVMGTPANLEILAEEGLAAETTPGLEGASANDLVLAVRGNEGLAAALAAGLETVFGEVADTSSNPEASDARPASLEQAAEHLEGANVAIVSVPGPFAALEAHKALSLGLNVLLFSDNVAVQDEIELKQRGCDLGKLVMGPGAGTAALAGIGLGFSNRVAPGPVGVVSAAGTGAQESMTLLHRWGVGVSHVIGVGGRDLSERVGGLMAEAAIEALDNHDDTELILLVSKPPAPHIAEKLLGPGTTKPLVAALIGLDEPVAVAPGTAVCNTLEQGVVEALTLLGRTGADPIGALDTEVAARITSLDPQRRRLVGLFSGGTLAYEAMTIASRHIGGIYSNTPLQPSLTLPAPADSHVCLDLGEEEFTQGRPHPMIDPEARVEILLEQAADPGVAVVLLDLVIGDGSHHDPASVLAPAVAELTAAGVAVVTYVLGTDLDPQGFAWQQSEMRRAGSIVSDTAARAALAAAAIVNRDPALVHLDLSVKLTK